jgi:hypothetical protein
MSTGMAAFAAAPEWVTASCVSQLEDMYNTTTAPFEGVFADYAAATQRNRYLEVCPALLLPLAPLCAQRMLQLHALRHANVATASSGQVRFVQLDREGEELREENAGLHERLAAVDEAFASATATAAQVR